MKVKQRITLTILHHQLKLDFERIEINLFEHSKRHLEYFSIFRSLSILQQNHQYYNLSFRMINNQIKFPKKNLFEEEIQITPAQRISVDTHAKSLNPLGSVLINGSVIQENQAEVKSFSEYGLTSQIVRALNQLGYSNPTKVQSHTLIPSLSNNDLLCLSQTGSGKTLSFLLPIINALQKQQNKSFGGFALIMAPTRQLCLQIQDYLIKFKEHGLSYCTSVVLHGGADTKMKQVIQLTKKPSFVIGTPGRILDHLENTKGFDLNRIKYLVLDEADKLLNLDFQKQINEILQRIPKQRIAYLYSATLTSKVEKLQRVSLNKPIRIEVNSKYKTVSRLEDSYIFVPSKWKDCYLVYLINRFKNDRIIIFGKTCLGVERLYLVLKELKFSVDCLHGNLSQPQRIKSLDNFKNKKCRVLVCTDVAARGIDIQDISLVINYDLCCPKDYIHRVGRTARIGKQGKAISIVTQYDVQNFQEIEKKLGKSIAELPVEQTEALIFLELLDRCHKEVSRKMKQSKRNSQ